MQIMCQNYRPKLLLLLKEHFFIVVLLYKTNYGIQFEDLSPKVFLRTIKLVTKELCIINFITLSLF
jgi:hypothetical protein